MAQRQTLDLQAVKTRQIIYQNPDGTFPSTDGVLTMGDARGHATWTRNPSVDTITLATGGTLAYDGSDLLLNGVPVQGVSSVTGGKNITVTDNSANPIVNLDIKENIDMSGNDLNNVNFVNVNSVINVGSLTTNNPTINLVTTNTGGTSINTYDGAISSTVEYTTVDTTMRMKSEANVELRAKNNAHAINLGPTSQSINIITYDDSSVVSRVNNFMSGHGMTTLSSDGTFQIGSIDISNDPSVRFQGVSAESVASIKMESSTGTLTVESTSATATMKIAVPLRDVSSDTAGVAGQVLTSAGTGAPPYWADGGVLGRYWTSISGEITIGSALFPALADLSGAVRMRVDIMGGGGGGGGAGSNSIVGAGSGGGGGQGFNKSGVITYAIGGTIYFEVGSGGAGGDGSFLLDLPSDGTDGEITTIRTSSSGRVLATASGGKGGVSGGTGAGVGGDGFTRGEDGVLGGGDGGTGGGYYGGTGTSASLLDGTNNGGINGIYTSGTGCGGGGGVRTNTVGLGGGKGDCGYCLIEILEVV